MQSVAFFGVAFVRAAVKVKITKVRDIMALALGRKQKENIMLGKELYDENTQDEALFRVQETELQTAFLDAVEFSMLLMSSCSSCRIGVLRNSPLNASAELAGSTHQYEQ